MDDVWLPNIMSQIKHSSKQNAYKKFRRKTKGTLQTTKEELVLTMHEVPIVALGAYNPMQIQ